MKNRLKKGVLLKIVFRKWYESNNIYDLFKAM